MLKNLKRWQLAQKFERQFWAEYKSEGKHESDPKIKYYESAIKLMGMIEPYSPNEVILDVGCGPGDMLNHIDSDFKVGLDPLFRFFVKRNLCGTKIMAVRGVSESLPFESNTFTKVFCYNVLDHVANPKKTIKEIRRVLKVNHCLLLAVDVRSPIVKCYRIAKEPLRKVSRSIDVLAHPHNFTLDNITKELKNCRFEIAKMKVGFGKTSPYIIPALIAKLLRVKCSSHFVCIIARKPDSPLNLGQATNS